MTLRADGGRQQRALVQEGRQARAVDARTAVIHRPAGSSRADGLTGALVTSQPRPVRVKVRLFASLREVAGPEVSLELPPGATAEEAWGRLAADFPALAPRRASLAVAVNRSYAAFDTVLREADEVALLPPVSGG